MTKFQKLQRYLCFIPAFSTAVISIITMIELKRFKVNFIAWMKFALIFFGSGIIVFILNEFIMTGQYPVLNVIASTAILGLANWMFVDLQYKCMVIAKERATQVMEEHSTGKNVLSDKQKRIVKLVAIWVIPLIVMVVFVSWKLTDLMQYHRDNTIADVNGESDFSLNTLTQEDILAEWYGYTMYASGASGDGNSTDVDSEWEDEDYDRRSMSVGSFSGVTVLQATKTDRESLTLDITSTVESGNFRIVITVDGAYYCDVEINKTTQVVLNDIQNKTVLIKLAGESAKFRAEVSRTYE